MAPIQGFADSNRHLHHETAIFNWFANPPLSVAATSQNTQSQHPYPSPLETPTGTSVIYGAPWQGMSQDPLPLEDAPGSSSTVLPRTITMSSDNSVHAALRSGISGMNLSDVGFTQPPATLPVILQPLPALPLLPVFTPRWTEVPQRPYEHGRRQWNFKKLEPVPFSVNGLPGINMGDALRKHFTGLDGRDDPVLQGATGVISCRLMFPGYPSNGSTQISTFGWAKERVRITRSKLAYEVAKKLDVYLRSMTGQFMDASTDQRWKIGEGFMQLDSLYLVRLVSVSKGSFQPEIWAMDTSM